MVQKMMGMFTDFGLAGPYVGQVKSVLLSHLPTLTVIDLMHDAPVFDPRASAYLLAALAPHWPQDMVVMAVVDPGVGGERQPLMANIDGHWLVGPDNGLFEILARRAQHAQFWRITWQPKNLSASFHGRDLFAPVAARLAQGDDPRAIGGESTEPQRFPHWPDDWAAVIYGDAYGNAMTGLRASALVSGQEIEVDGRRLARARTFSDLARGDVFFYENSLGLVEIAISQGRACDDLNLKVGSIVRVLD